MVSIHFQRPQKLGPVGECVYCGDTSDLRSEHIVPFSLYGQIELVCASCGGCAKITGRFEGNVARGMLGRVRIRQEIATRRKRERPTTLPLLLDKGAGLESVEVPIDEHPAYAPLVWLNMPSLLRNKTSNEDFSFSIDVAGHELISRPENSVLGTAATISISPKSFMRLLAKIAHCFTVLHLGLDGFSHVLCDVITNDSVDINEIHKYVGGNPMKRPPDAGLISKLNSKHAHLLQLTGVRMVTGLEYCIVKIVLFSGWLAEPDKPGMPEYYVISGIFNELTLERLRLSPYYKEYIPRKGGKTGARER